MRWLVADSLSTPEQFFCSHLDSYGHYLREAGEEVDQLCWPAGGWNVRNKIGGADFDVVSGIDVLFALDRYDVAIREYDFAKPKLTIAQVAARCRPMPWEVRKADGSPAYDLVLSSIPAMVEEARAAGCRAEYMPLAFDTRARVCMMSVKREARCIFIGTVGSNHRRRTQLLHELSDVVDVLPPVFGREYFKALAGAAMVLNVHAEWAQGTANNMRMFEATGMGCELVTDGDADRQELWPADNDSYDRVWTFETAAQARAHIGKIRERRAEYRFGWNAEQVTLREHTYVERIPRLIELARSLG